MQALIEADCKARLATVNSVHVYSLEPKRLVVRSMHRTGPPAQ